jgi:hypothetical protein
MLDLDKIDLKKAIKEIQKDDTGKERGNDIKFLVSYVRREKGEDGFKKVKAELKRCGYELPDLSKIKDMDWIPSSWPTIFMLASAKCFNWREEEIMKMGQSVVYSHLGIKRFLRYFMSVETTLKMGADSWRKFYTFGRVKINKYDEKKKLIVVRLEDFKKHPVVCPYLLGVFSKLIEMIVGAKVVRAEETKCVFRGDPYHEFVYRYQ